VLGLHQTLRDSRAANEHASRSCCAATNGIVMLVLASITVCHAVLPVCIPSVWSRCLQWGNDEGGKGCRRVRTWHHQRKESYHTSSAAPEVPPLTVSLTRLAEALALLRNTPSYILGGCPAFQDFASFRSRILLRAVDAESEGPCDGASLPLSDRCPSYPSAP
jgi:hypothetical protein